MEKCRCLFKASSHVLVQLTLRLEFRVAAAERLMVLF